MHTHIKGKSVRLVTRHVETEELFCRQWGLFAHSYSPNKYCFQRQSDGLISFVSSNDIKR